MTVIVVVVVVVGMVVEGISSVWVMVLMKVENVVVYVLMIPVWLMVLMKVEPVVRKIVSMVDCSLLLLDTVDSLVDIVVAVVGMMMVLIYSHLFLVVLHSE